MDNEKEDFETQLTAALLEIESLKAEIETAKADIAAKTNELAAVYQVNEELKAEIEKLTAKVSASPANSLPFATQTFESDGQQYGFNFGATIFKGQKITPVEIMADANLQAELIKMNAGILKKL